MSVEFVEKLKKQWMAMIDAIADPLVLLDSNYNILRQNKSYVELALNEPGADIRAFRGQKCYELFAGRESPCVNCKLKDSLTQERDPHWTTTDLFPDKTIEVTVHRMPREEFEDQAAAPSERDLFVVHYRDVSEKRLLQDSLARADKLAALGKLAGGVAHEINSPLAGILAFSQMVLRELNDENPHKQDLLEIEDAARKCKVIVEGLLGFARQDQPAERTAVNIFNIIRSTLRLVSPMLSKNHVQLATNFSNETDATFIGSSGKLSQVFLNLITNAIYAMKDEGGLLEIEGQATHSSVRITVRDSGPGIEPHHIGKIFDPFFTTKPIGEGTGLGLSITYSIVKQHGGTISVHSAPGVGTAFSVELPKNIEPTNEELS
jgi:two-component system NtrC family sensor kinase